MQDPAQPNYQLLCQGKKLKIIIHRRMEACESPSPLSRTSVPGHIQAGLSTGRGLLLFPAGFTAGGCDATASSAALRREGASQGQRGVPPTLKLVFLPSSLSQDDPGVRGAYGRSGGRWAPRSAAGSGRRRPAGPRPGGCRHLEIGGDTVRSWAPSAQVMECGVGREQSSSGPREGLC